MYDQTGKIHFSSIKLVSTLGIRGRDISNFIHLYGVELRENGLIEINHMRVRHYPNFFTLKPLAIEYFTGVRESSA